MLTRVKNYFSKTELFIWFFSLITITVSFVIFDRENYFVVMASLIGVTSLTLNAKGNPYGQLLTIIFSVFYGIISLRASYYGEMITYLGMTAPMALYSMVTWMKNTTKEDSLEVKIRKMELQETIVMLILAIVVTGMFYFILKKFDTMNLSMSFS